MVKPKRFYMQELATAGSAQTLFTVPTGHTYTIKQIILCSLDEGEKATGVTFTYNNGTTDLVLIGHVQAPRYDSVVLDLDVALAAGSSLKANISIANLRIMVAGYDHG